MSSWSEGAAPVPRVVPIRRIRVLVLSGDRRFLRVTAFLLRRKGFAVKTGSRWERSFPLPDHDRPDVVVIDGNGSIADAVRSLAVVETVRPEVAVVVVSEEGLERPAGRFRFLPKWSAGHRLAQEVERAYFRLGPA